jgi:ABC-2 family transporter
MLQAIPPLIGAFIGAPLLAREPETGTFRYTWTQAFGRWRWTLAKLVPLAVVLATAAGVFSLLLNWYFQPYFAPGNEKLTLEETTPFFPGIFDLRGIGFAAWTLAAFSIGALAGMLIRRVVPAIVATLVAYAALAFTAGVPAPALPSAAGYQQPGRARLRLDHQPVVDQGRHIRLRRLSPRQAPAAVLPERPARAGGAFRQVGKHRGVPYPARLHAVDRLSARQPVLGVPVDRGRLAARAVGAADRRDRVAGPPPGDLTARSAAR